MRFSVYQVSRRGGREKNEDRMGYCYTRDAGLFALALFVLLFGIGPAGKIAFGSAGNGSAQHLALEMFKLRAGIDVLIIDLNLAIDGLTSFTTAPLRASAVLGFVVSVAAFIYLLEIVIKGIITGSDVSGYPSTMAAILFLGGVQLLSLGIIGEYVGKVFNETKNRPPYLIGDTNLSSESNVSGAASSKPLTKARGW
mgnify:CR=1 FL=1